MSIRFFAGAALGLIAAALLFIAAVLTTDAPPPPLAVTVQRYVTVENRPMLVLLAHNPGPGAVRLRLADITAYDGRGQPYTATGDGETTIGPGGSDLVTLTFPADVRLASVVVAPDGRAPTVISEWGR